MRPFLSVLLMSLALSPASAAEEDSVLVTTMAPRRGPMHHSNAVNFLVAVEFRAI
jgi:hypothetical protein